MAVVGLIVHRRRPEATQAAVELSEWLIKSGHKVRMPAESAGSIGSNRVETRAENFGCGLDLVVTLGGDGSILQAVRLIGTSEVPVLGIDFGRLGYLSEVKPIEAQSAIRRALAGDCQIEERLLLAMAIRFSGDVDRSTAATTCGTTHTTNAAHTTHTETATAAGSSKDGIDYDTAAGLVQVALNEVFIERGRKSNTIRLKVYVDGDMFTTYSADGLIVATPTGSTAYAFSARGPIIDPQHRALLLTPVSPHMLFDRSLVVPDSTRLRVVVDGDRPAVVSVDGQRVAELGDGDVVECYASPHSARFVTFGARRFHQVLKAKFGLNGPIDL